MTQERRPPFCVECLRPLRESDSLGLRCYTNGCARAYTGINGEPHYSNKTIDGTMVNWVRVPVLRGRGALQYPDWPGLPDRGYAGLRQACDVCEVLPGAWCKPVRHLLAGGRAPMPEPAWLLAKRFELETLWEGIEAQWRLDAAEGVDK